MRKEKLKEIIKNLLVVIVVSLILVSILALIYSLTQNRIKINEALVKKKAVLIAAGFSIPQNITDILKLYDSSIKEIQKDDQIEIYKYENKQIDEDNVFNTGYVLIYTGPGLWGEITIALGFGKDLKTISGLEFLAQNETPGLGGRIVEPWFKSQFKGKVNILRIVNEKQKPLDEEISGITGATNTTKYVINLINIGKEYINQLDLKN